MHNLMGWRVFVGGRFKFSSRGDFLHSTQTAIRPFSKGKVRPTCLCFHVVCSLYVDAEIGKKDVEES